MKTQNGTDIKLAAGDTVIFHEEGTVSFFREPGKYFRLGVSGDDKFFLDEFATRNRNLCSSIADLIAKTHGLLGTVSVEGVRDHHTFKFK